MIKINESLINELRTLEESLWKAETRYNVEYQEQVFSEDCFEFGRSGRIYTRSEMIRSDGYEIHAKLPLINFKVIAIDDHTVLITYQSEAKFDVIEKANRSSIWSNNTGSWQLRFHQGTSI